MTPPLEAALLETFYLRIVNEYDLSSSTHRGAVVDGSNRYMATRYLQLQHTSRTGRTSGDGRSIWNGCVRHDGRLWDVSSCGTGVTALAPGAVAAGTPLQTGSREFGYASGLAELGELMEAAIMSEVMHRQGLHTERVLYVIDIGDGNGIGVRAASSLIRPAHLFRHLKQGNREGLRRAIDYVIDRQHANGEWTFDRSDPCRYDKFAHEVALSFAKFAARLDVDYIFAWLDWDGDNVLLPAGLLDYGSVRQFGMRHDRYRYLDTGRWSKALRDQPRIARAHAQAMAQACDFVATGHKRPLASFGDHRCVRAFDAAFADGVRDRILFRTGYDASARARLGRDHLPIVDDLVADYQRIERVKAPGPVEWVGDGTNTPAAYKISALLRELPTRLLTAGSFADCELTPEAFVAIMENPARESVPIGPSGQDLSSRFQRHYKALLLAAAGHGELNDVVAGLARRSAAINNSKRLSGHGLVSIVEQLLKARATGLAPSEIQALVEAVIATQHLDPDPLALAPPSGAATTQVFTSLLETVEVTSYSV